MNAHAFALVAQEPDGLSRLDLSNDEVVKDAAHELRRCATDAQFAAWARRWGEGLTARAAASAAPRTQQPMPIEERLL